MIVAQFIKEKKLINAGDTVLVGVSGGADSVALIYLLAELRHSLGLRLHIAHYNHNVRRESIKDQAFVERLGQKLNIPVIVEQRKGGVKDQLSEEQMRQLRIQFFTKWAKKLKAQSVALAHTENDLAETVLMRLIRGTGLYGLRGILPVRNMDGVLFIRPLLSSSRKEIEHYLKTKKSDFCQDASNQQTKYLRNKLRLKLLPLLAADYNPNISRVLMDLAQTAGEDYDFLLQKAQKSFKENVVVGKEKIKITLKDLAKAHPAIRRLLLRQMVESFSRSSVGLSFDHIGELEALLTDRPVRSLVHLPGGLCMSKTTTHLELFHA